MNFDSEVYELSWNMEFARLLATKTVRGDNMEIVSNMVIM